MIDRETPQTALEAYLEARVEALEEALRIALGTTDTAKALLRALQDEGFVIKDADEDHGLTMAARETESPRRFGSRGTVFHLSALSR